MDNVLTLIAGHGGHGLDSSLVFEVRGALRALGAEVGSADWLSPEQACDLEFSGLATAQADAATFTSLLSQYDKYPGLIAKTIYEETLFRVVNNVDEKFVLQPAANRQLRVLLNRNLDKAPKAAGDKP